MGSDVATFQLAQGETDSPPTQYTPDPICERIHIYYNPNPSPPGIPSRSYSTPEWTAAQVERLTALSPKLKTRINELRACPTSDKIWVIEPGVEEGFDLPTVYDILNMLATSGESTAGTRIDATAPVVSKHCNALWSLEVIPTRFPSSKLWRVLDESHNVIGSFYHPLVTTNDVHERVGWCWNESSCRHTLETALQLSNCYLILGWEELFKESIKPVIWDWTATETVFRTPVKHLKAAGRDGLNNLRKQEKEKIIEHIHQYLDRKRKSDAANVDRTLKDLQGSKMELHEPENFNQTSIYKMMQDIEHVTMKQKRASGSSSHHPSIDRAHTHNSLQSQHPNHHHDHHNHHHHHRTSGGAWHLKLEALASKLESKFSGAEEHTKFVRDMLDDTHKFILKRQKEVPVDMLTWRDEEINMWERHL